MEAASLRKLPDGTSVGAASADAGNEIEMRARCLDIDRGIQRLEPHRIERDAQWFWLAETFPSRDQPTSVGSSDYRLAAAA